MSEKNEADFRKLWNALADIEQVRAVIKQRGKSVCDCTNKADMARIKIALAKQLDCYNYDTSGNDVIAACPACTEAGDNGFEANCKRCPIHWKETGDEEVYQCEHGDSLYILWRNAQTLEEACPIAAQIAELPWEHRS